jgi:hypothetical protein
MGQSACGLRFLSFVHCVRNKLVQSVNSVSEYSRKILGKGIARTNLQPEICSIHQQDASAAVCGIRSLKVAKNTLDLTLLRQRNCHVKAQPDHVPIKVLDCQHAPEFIHIAALNRDPTPKRNRFSIDSRSLSVPE